ncbi:MAG TPA: serine hydrolase, partial [Vicinamibacterales bacterium]|nr:serine hydrolase [Vicinamibacterales bacterium]
QPFHNPFGALGALRDRLPARPADPEPEPAPAAPPAGGKTYARAVVRLERSGRGGKEATLVEKLDLTPAERDTWLKALKAALGCGGRVEGDTLMLQGDQRKRLPALLTARGVKKITLALVLAFTAAFTALFHAAGQAPVFPGAAWERVSDPTTVGYCQAGLDAASARATKLATTGAIAIVGGRVLWEYGDLQFVSYLASVRKSILAMQFGPYVKSGRIRLDKTIKELRITDLQGLMPAELDATILHLLSARSGVYHPASNAASSAGGDTVGEPPARGSVRPGTYFLYNNWDFNALGTIFEQETGDNIYDAFARDFAGPMQFQDFDRAAQRKSGNAQRSQHPAYHYFLSTRDMARIGYLMLREGQWAGREIVPRDWARRIVTPVTPVAEMNPDQYRRGPWGYGLLWWLWDGPFAKGDFTGAYTGIGAVGQFITVLPARDLVIAHKTRQGARSVGRDDYLDLVDAILAAKCRR